MRWWILAFALLAVVTSGVFIILPELARPNQNEMRLYRLSLLTDTKLRELHEAASAEAEVKKVEASHDKEKARDKLRSELAACESRMKDPAFRARQQSCNYLPLQMLDGHIAYRSPSAEEMFEQMIMGVCVYAGSVHEARALRCLPPRFWTSRAGWTSP